MKTQMEIIIVSRLAVELWIESIQRGDYDYLPNPGSLANAPVV